MNTYDVAIFVVCAILLINKASREGAFVLITGKAFYFLFIIDTSAVWYYSLSATINLVMGLFLYHKYKWTSFCAFLLVPVSVIGFWLWFNYYPPDLYNLIFAIILTAQLLLVIPRILTHGRYGNNIQYTLDGFVSFNSCSPYVTMHKMQQEKKTICAKK